jgi:hypothetical protein
MFRNNHTREVCTFKKSTVSNELAGFRTSGSAILEAISADGKKKKRRGNLWGADCVCRESFTHGAQYQSSAQNHRRRRAAVAGQGFI